MFDVLFPFVTYVLTLPRTTREERFTAASLVYTQNFSTSPTYCVGSDGVSMVIILSKF
jgi:hypothetical protein